MFKAGQFHNRHAGHLAVPGAVCRVWREQLMFSEGRGHLARLNAVCFSGRHTGI